MGVGYLTHGFDLLNVRDLDVIGQAQQGCSALVVGVVSDELFEQRYGRPPVVPFSERLAVVSRVRGVHAAVAQTGPGVPEGLQPEVVWAVAGEPALLDEPTPRPLTARRETSSGVLRAALSAVEEDLATEVVA